VLGPLELDGAQGRSLPHNNEHRDTEVPVQWVFW